MPTTLKKELSVKEKSFYDFPIFEVTRIFTSASENGFHLLPNLQIMIYRYTNIELSVNDL